jgi:4-amino-4-deoxy-L-arabinose transferase-like glycosyltransferase
MVRDDAVGGDGYAYQKTAAFLDEGKGFLKPLSQVPSPDAMHPPLWALVLTVPRKLGYTSQLDAQVFACLIGTATVVVVGIIGRHLGGARVGLIAAAFAAVFPEAWMYERELLSESLLLLVVGLVVLVIYRFIATPGMRLAVVLGALCGALALTRAEQVLYLPAAVTPAILLVRSVPFRRRAAWVLAAGLMTTAVIAPWTIYNLGRFNRPVLLSYNMGGAILIGSCDSTYYGKLIGYYDIRCNLAGHRTHRDTPDSSELDYKLRADALHYAATHLARLPLVVLAREGRAWSLFAPFETARSEAAWSETRPWVHELGVVIFWALAALAIYGAFSLRRSAIPVYPLVAFFAIVAGVTAITFGQTRYRAAAAVPLLILAAVGADAISRHRSARSST